ncbi:MAG: APC family permease [Planctomycetota bacterium]|nr:APC family permease [Planctomycetota bacterium]MDA1213123.1 APC family permease [Planctomycetota bacterium]
MSHPSTESSTSKELPRVVGIVGATMMGLGSIVGTGIFVSIGNAAGAAGSSVVLAIAVAAVVATLNGLNSAQLAAAHPISGGTYEYGYRWLHPSLGFTAGWMFLWAKSASAATAALGFAGYLLNLAGPEYTEWRIGAGLVCVVVLTLLVLSGIRRSNELNIAIVSITLISLLAFVIAGLSTTTQTGTDPLTWNELKTSITFHGWPGFLEACALMFVAYTGYGRIATLGEEIRNPQRNIPLAIIVTLAVSMLLYISVGYVAIASVGSKSLAAASQQQAAPLEIVARQFDVNGLGIVIAVGAMTSMLGVLLNLILGLSRVMLAMGRRRDLPSRLGRLNHAGTTPSAAVVVVGFIIAGLVLLGDVKTTWSFSAFTVLIYYALTNLAAMRMSPEERRFPRFVAVLGLMSCLFLAFWVEQAVWIAGISLIVVGLIWQQAALRFHQLRAKTST